MVGDVATVSPYTDCRGAAWTAVARRQSRNPLGEAA